MTDDDLFTSPNASHPEVKRDRWGRYLLPPVSGGPATGRTRVTTFARTISDTFTLNLWSQRMAVKGLSVRPDLHALAASTPVEDRDTLNRIVEDAKAAANAKSGANLGSALHSFTEAVDRGDTPTIPTPLDKDVHAYQAALDNAGIEILPEFIERVVTVEAFNCGGTFDRIVKLGKEYLVLDLKTGRDLAYGWGEISVQLALYAHADAIWELSAQEYSPMPPVSRHRALVAHAPVGTGKCTIYQVDIGAGWEAAQLCGRVREWRKIKNLAHELAPPIPGWDDGPVTGPDEDVPDCGWEDMVASAESKEELSALWKEGFQKGWWTPAMTELGKKRMAQLRAG